MLPLSRRPCPGSLLDGCSNPRKWPASCTRTSSWQTRMCWGECANLEQVWALTRQLSCVLYLHRPLPSCDPGSKLSDVCVGFSSDMRIRFPHAHCIQASEGCQPTMPTACAMPIGDPVSASVLPPSVPCPTGPALHAPEHGAECLPLAPFCPVLSFPYLRRCGGAVQDQSHP